MNDERRNKKPMTFEDMYVYIEPDMTQIINRLPPEKKIDTKPTNIQSSLK
jgi:hypothetical protein